LPSDVTVGKVNRPYSPLCPFKFNFSLLLALGVLLCACASVPRAERVSSIKDFIPQWQEITGKSGPFFGVEMLAGKITDPSLEFWALRVDLDDPRIGIVVGPPPLEGKPGTVPSIKVSSFVRDFGCIAGINANPFDPSSAAEGEERAVAGLAVSNGTLIAGPQNRYDALVFYRQNPAIGGNSSEPEQFPRAAVLSQAAVDAAAVEHAVGGFYRVLEGGEVTGRNGARHPRSAAGLSLAGNILYLLVIDGRRPGSMGATEAETGMLLRQLGAAAGLCFDGGGSSALAIGALVPEQTGVKVLNKPVHIPIPGTERAVAVCLGVSFH
jgi:hypothetical protein